MLGSQDESGPALVGLDLVQRGLDLPPLGIQRSEFGCRCCRGIEDGGHQPVDRAVGVGVEGVLDNADPDRVSAAVLIPRGDDLRQIRAVVKELHHGQHRTALHPPQQVRTGRGSGPPQIEADKAAVGQQQHPRRQAAEQPPGQRGLVHGQRPDLGSEDGMGTALDHRGHPCLRERTPPQPARGPRPSEDLGIAPGVWQVKGGAIHGDQPPGALPGPDGLLCRYRSAHPGEQCLDGFRTQPKTSPADRRRRRHPPCPLPPPLAFKAARQQPCDLLIALSRKQAHRKHEVDHHPRWKKSATLFLPPTLSDRLIDQLRRKRARQHTQRDPIRELLNRRSLHLSGPWHTTPNNQQHPKSPVLSLDH